MEQVAPLKNEERLIKAMTLINLSKYLEMPNVRLAHQYHITFVD